MTFRFPDDPPSGSSHEAIQRAIAILKAKRAAHLDIWISALISIDPEAPDKYELIEERSEDGLRTRWWFERKQDG